LPAASGIHLFADVECHQIALHLRPRSQGFPLGTISSTRRISQRLETVLIQSCAILDSRPSEIFQVDYCYGRLAHDRCVCFVYTFGFCVASNSRKRRAMHPLLHKGLLANLLGTRQLSNKHLQDCLENRLQYYGFFQIMHYLFLLIALRILTKLSSQYSSKVQGIQCSCLLLEPRIQSRFQVSNISNTRKSCALTPDSASHASDTTLTKIIETQNQDTV
jgi:hypothetical protein